MLLKTHHHQRHVRRSLALTSRKFRTACGSISPEESSVLFISPVWPERSSSAAGVRTADLVSGFQSRRFNVAFASPSAPNNHTALLQASGIKTFQCPPNRQEEIAYVLHSVKPSIVVFDRFCAEEMYSFWVRDLIPEALRVLDMQDMHSLREARRQIAEKGAPMNSVMDCRPDTSFQPLLRELAAIHRSDLSLVCSPVEMDILITHYGMDPENLAFAPFFVPLSPHAAAPENRSKREHFMMIGNFRHAPNLDSAQWTCQEIWPKIRNNIIEDEYQESLPELHIYGAYAPQSASKLHQPARGVHVKGFAPSLDIMAQYAVLLAPLRYGAGLKGKIVDAWWHGLPVATTPIGAEGMGGGEEYDGDSVPGLPVGWGGMHSARTSDEIAEQAGWLYRDNALWHQSQRRGFELLREFYDRDSTLDAVFSAIHRARSGMATARLKKFTSAILWQQQMRSTEYFSKWIELKERGGVSTQT